MINPNDVNVNMEAMKEAVNRNNPNNGNFYTMPIMNPLMMTPIPGGIMEAYKKNPVDPAKSESKALITIMRLIGKSHALTELTNDNSMSDAEKIGAIKMFIKQCISDRNCNGYLGDTDEQTALKAVLDQLDTPEKMLGWLSGIEFITNYVLNIYTSYNDPRL